jgi:hypothetical protein
MNFDPLSKRKMSDMISERAVPFISEGKTAEEKNSRLTAACSAWNMAVSRPHRPLCDNGWAQFVIGEPHVT